MHPCQVKNGGCEQLCLPSWRNGTGVATCACEEGLTAREGRCEHADEDSPLLIFGKMNPASIVGIPLKEKWTKQEEMAMPPVLRLFRPSAIAVDVASRKFFYSDARKFSIFRRRFQDRQVETLTDRGLSSSPSHPSPFRIEQL